MPEAKTETETGIYTGPGRAIDSAAGQVEEHGTEQGADRCMTETERSLSELSAEEIRDLWSRTYNRDGKPDWSHLFPYYRDDVVFRDSIQEVPVTKDEVDNRILVSRFVSRRIPTEDVEYVATVMKPCWDLTVAVVRQFPTRIGESLGFISLGVLDKGEVRVCIPPGSVVVNGAGIKPSLEPVLKVILLIGSAHLAN